MQKHSTKEKQTIIQKQQNANSHIFFKSGHITETSNFQSFIKNRLITENINPVLNW